MTLASILFRRPATTPMPDPVPPPRAMTPLQRALKRRPTDPAPPASGATATTADQPNANPVPIAVRERLALFVAKR